MPYKKSGEWVESDPDPINPCRVPPGYRMLGCLEATRPGDIYWHNLDTKWCPLRTTTGTPPYIYNFPVARKLDPLR